MLASYSTSIDHELSLTPFLNDQVYKDKPPIKGVYFYDVVSVSIGQFDFCGPKLFSFSGDYPSCVSFSGSNGDTLTLKAATNCKVGNYNVNLTVSLSQNALISLVTTF